MVSKTEAGLKIAGDCVAYPLQERDYETADHPSGQVVGQSSAPGHMRRSILGNSCHTLTPQKCEPSVQIGVVTPART